MSPSPINTACNHTPITISATLEGLPRELQETILNFLSIKKIAELRILSKSWRNLNTDFFTKKVNIQNIVEPVEKFLAEKTASSAAALLPALIRERDTYFYSRNVWKENSNAAYYYMISLLSTKLWEVADISITVAAKINKLIHTHLYASGPMSNLAEWRLFQALSQASSAPQQEKAFAQLDFASTCPNIHSLEQRQPPFSVGDSVGYRAKGFVDKVYMKWVLTLQDWELNSAANLTLQLFWEERKIFEILDKLKQINRNDIASLICNKWLGEVNEIIYLEEYTRTLTRTLKYAEEAKFDSISRLEIVLAAMTKPAFLDIKEAYKPFMDGAINETFVVNLLDWINAEKSFEVRMQRLLTTVYVLSEISGKNRKWIPQILKHFNYSTLSAPSAKPHLDRALLSLIINNDWDNLNSLINLFQTIIFPETILEEALEILSQDSLIVGFKTLLEQKNLETALKLGKKCIQKNYQKIITVLKGIRVDYEKISEIHLFNFCLVYQISRKEMPEKLENRLASIISDGQSNHLIRDWFYKESGSLRLLNENNKEPYTNCFFNLQWELLKNAITAKNIALACDILEYAVDRKYCLRNLDGEIAQCELETILQLLTCEHQIIALPIYQKILQDQFKQTDNFYEELLNWTFTHLDNTNALLVFFSVVNAVCEIDRNKTKDFFQKLESHQEFSNLCRKIVPEASYSPFLALKFIYHYLMYSQNPHLSLFNFENVQENSLEILNAQDLTDSERQEFVKKGLLNFLLTYAYFYPNNDFFWNLYRPSKKLIVFLNNIKETPNYKKILAKIFEFTGPKFNEEKSVVELYLGLLSAHLIEDTDSLDLLLAIIINSPLNINTISDYLNENNLERACKGIKLLLESHPKFHVQKNIMGLSEALEVDIEQIAIQEAAAAAERAKTDKANRQDDYENDYDEDYFANVSDQDIDDTDLSEEDDSID